MGWLGIVLIRLAFGGGLGTYVTKCLASEVNREARFVAVYLVQLVLCLLLILFSGGNLSLSLELALVGIGNSFGTYCMWRAYSLSVSKASVYMIGDDLLALALGYVLLNEMRYLSPLLFLGVLLSLGACFFQGLISYKQGNRDKVSFKHLLLWAVGFCVPWGIVDFYFGYANVRAISNLDFALSYYFGSFIMAALIWIQSKNRSQVSVEAQVLVSNKILIVLILASINFGCFMLDYAAFGRAPITVVQPWLQVGGMVLPSIVGLVAFGEHKDFNRKSTAAYLVGMLGAALIAFSFRT